MLRITWIGSFVLLALVVSSARAQFIPPHWPRPQSAAEADSTRTTYQSWDLFLDEVEPGVPPIVDPTPDIANVNPNGSPTVTESGGAIVTGSGNIYSPATPIQLQVDLPGFGSSAGNRTNFLVQLRTLGSELVRTNPGEDVPTYDFSRFSLDGVPLASLMDFSYTELSRASGFGATVEHAFGFSVPYSADQFVLAYESLSSSSSQDRISIDTQVVPEPSAVLLGTVGLLVLGAGCRRKRAR